MAEDLQLQVREVLERFNNLVSTRNMQVLAEFAPGDDVLLVGSEVGECAKGRQELEMFFARIFARDITFSWEWDNIEVSRAGNIAWLFADGWVILSTGKEQRRTPYRITGILEHEEKRWRWRLYNGSEPVTNAGTSIQ